ncbi:MAG: NADH-quinone oxidoreductase subunit NuoF [Nitrospinota bacterium]|nr:NADH-quinone oxidoreductase subunit NuoF [Nitrospinota bacterium]
MSVEILPIVTKNVGKEGSHTLEGALANGVYQGIERILDEKADPAEVIETVKASGLRGRGGAGFPTGVKWGFVPKDHAGPKYLCVNGDESEPGTFKDRLLMEEDPHRVVEGALIACYAVGIQTAYLYVRGEFGRAYRRLRAAVDEAYAAGRLGRDILGSGFNCEIHLHRGAGAYICGEETGLLESLEGKRGQPRPKPPFPALEGLYASPTVVNNVETLCFVPDIITRGPEWFTGIGFERNAGTRVFAVSGHVNKPGCYELPLSVTCREIIDDHAGGIPGGRKLKAVIPGGASAPMLTADEIDVRMGFDTLAAIGTMGGSGAVIVMDETADIVRATYILMRFFHHESCGQCTPCREGTGWAYRIMGRIVDGTGRPEDLDLLLEMVGNIKGGRCLCPLGDAACGPLESGIRKFPEEFEAYVRRAPALA